MTNLEMEPMGKPRMTQRDRWKGRPVVTRYHVYCDTLRLLLPRYELPGHLSITFGVAVPQSWSNKRKELYIGKPHTQKPDIDNLAKAFMDAFKTDDSHVHTLTAKKLWSAKGYILIQ